MLLSSIAGPAAAANNSTATSSNSSAAPPGTYISENVRLLDSGYNQSSGEAFVELRSTKTMAVTISDGGALSTGSGEIASRTFVLDAGETTRVVLPVTKTGGRVAVVIDTPGVLYGHIIKTSDSIVGPGGFTARDAQITAASGALVVAIVSIVMVVRYLAGTNDAPERIA
ncbi:hypothetical protein ACFR9U_04210 [Halorientalis brevis]|uniref:Uncharacterized protein n=1 Tax=Halorientalis brevis TaxID=1126241 RepID=A0ABD6C9L1_9EURY